MEGINEITMIQYNETTIVDVCEAHSLLTIYELMKKISTQRIHEMYQWIETAEKTFDKSNISVTEKLDELALKGRRAWETMLMFQSAFQLSFPQTVEALKYLFEESNDAIISEITMQESRYERLRKDFIKVQTVFEMECREHAFVGIPRKDAEFYNIEKPFGDEVYDHFREYREDITNASNCRAFALYDASVFYLMRIMESSMQKIGKKLNVILRRNGEIILVEDAQWEHILTAIENQINASYKQEADRKHIVSPFILSDREKYEGLIIQLRGVKNVWRNPVMHPHDNPITPGRASDILMAVELYLKSLIPILV
jgi:hypothetical protein